MSLARRSAGTLAATLAAVLLASTTAGAADFDGDGLEDLAIGAPRETLRVGSEGSAHVLYGASQGFLDLARDQVLSAATPGVAGPGLRGSVEFGGALATGDFDRDGHDDVAIGVPLEKTRKPGGKPNERVAQAGAVHVLYGSNAGITTKGDRYLTESTPGIEGNGSRPYDWFGAQITSGDFDGDGYDDLALTGGDERRRGKKRERGGAIHVLFGSKRGITTRGSQLFANATPDAELLIQFGYGGLAAGDFDRDRKDELAVGANGRVYVFAGSRRGLGKRPVARFAQATRGIAGSSALGGPLAAGDFGGDRADDLAVGAPGEDVDDEYGGTDFESGAVHVLYGKVRRGVRVRGNQFFTKATPGIAGGPPPGGDGLGGDALAAGDLNGDDHIDLAIGGRTNVHVLYSDGKRLSPTGSQFFTQSTPGMAGDGDTRDFELFGYAVASADLDGDGIDELAIGEPHEDLEIGQGSQPCERGGGLHLLAGTSFGVTLAGNAFLTQDTPGIEGDGDEICDAFGATILNRSSSGGLRFPDEALFGLL